MHLTSAQPSSPKAVKAARANGAVVPLARDSKSLGLASLLGPWIDWTTWREHLASREARCDLGVAALGPVCAWGLDAHTDQVSDEQRQLILYAHSVERAAGPALTGRSSDEHSHYASRALRTAETSFCLGSALSWLACARALPNLAQTLDDETWLRLLAQLIELTKSDDDSVEPIAGHLLKHELSLVLGYLFPELPACGPLLGRGWQSIARSIECHLDENGTLRAFELEVWPMLAASWARSRIIADLAVCASLDAELAMRYQHLLINLWRLRRPDGRQVFAAGGRMNHRNANEGFWRAARRYAIAGQQALIDAVFSPVALSRRAERKSSSATLLRSLSPAAESEVSRLAILRPHWSSADRFVVDYRRGDMRGELIAGGEVLLSGACTVALTLDGLPLTPDAMWEQVCWVSDDDADYLELQLSFDRGVRIQRHLLLAREDRFLFWADAVLGVQPGAIKYRCTLPLADGIAFQPAGETREGCLVGRRRRATVLPLALAEWRAEPSAGGLAQGERGLELSQTATHARALFAPLWIDLAPRRLTRAVTWRRLTVAEDRAIQPPDVAAGYRVAVGREQWLFYRSLDACGNRTVLGHNLVTEFFAARFSREGVAEPLMEIEPPSNHGSETP